MIRFRTFMAATCLLTGTGAPSQARAAEALPGGSIEGAVVDVGTGAPVIGAMVHLRPMEHLGGAAGAEDLAQGSRSTISDSLGHYHFENLPAGSYRIRTTHLAYRPFEVQVEVGPRATRHVSIGLVLESIRLPAVEVRLDRPPFERPPSGPGMENDSKRLDPQFHSRGSLAADVRHLTFGSVVESVTLGGLDLFRALQRYPGVSTRSDYTAELWTRGSPWHETRVYFDGVPIFNPLHGFGAFSGISPSAAGAVVFHPGVRPASIGEGAAGVVDFYTRRGAGTGRLNVRGDLSLVSAGVALDQQVADGRVSWMVSGRRTYLDWLTNLASEVADRPELHIPYAFSDVIGRVDLRLPGERSIELSGIRELDRMTSEGPAATWGNTAARATYASGWQGLRLRHTLSASRYAATAPEWNPHQFLPIQGYESESGIRHLSMSGEVSSRATPEEPGGWAAGYEGILQSVHSTGSAVLPIPRPRRGNESPVTWTTSTGGEAAAGDPVQPRSDLLFFALWGDRVWSTERFTLQSGMRLEVGQAVKNGGALRASPRLSARYRLAPSATLSAGLSRAYQYTQALAPAGVQLASLSSSYAWVLSSPEVPALRADLLTLGLGLHPRPGWEATATFFSRSSTGVVGPDPRPGPLFGRIPWVSGDAFARGVELSSQWNAGRWRGTGSYTYASSTETAAGLRFRSAVDQRHAVDLTSHLHVSEEWTWSAAFSSASGIPFTRVFGMDIGCPDGGSCTQQPIPWAGPPNERRSPPYASLDLGMDWARRRSALEWGGFLQVRNVLGRANGTVYTGAAPSCASGACDPRAHPEDRFERGLPRLLVLGLRVRR